MAPFPEIMPRKPDRIRKEGVGHTRESEKNCRQIVRHSLQTVCNWRILCMLPLFVSANNDVNGMNFTIRTRSLNGSFYWIAQKLRGLLVGLILDMPEISRPTRARVAWRFLFATGMDLLTHEF
ncbi:unnamed protein product [Penicillium glandicola]